jgi:L-ascorbate metabolism protein UlaG (beta-lactamase superfamily)
MSETARLVWLGQSGFLIRLGEANILVDAFLSPHPERLFRSELTVSDRRFLDVIACTHDHLDHLDRDALPALASESPQARVVVPGRCVDVVAALGISRNRIVGLQPEEAVTVAGVTIRAVRARHAMHATEPYTFEGFLGFVFSAAGIAIYHAGDTIGYDGLGAHLRELRVNVCLLPINGRDAAREARDIVGNLDEDEAAQLAIESGAEVAIPMHYDMFAGNPGDPARMVAAVERLGDGVRVVVPARSRPFVYTPR